MEREDFLALLDVMQMQEVYAPPAIDQEKLAAMLVAVLSEEQGGKPAIVSPDHVGTHSG